MKNNLRITAAQINTIVGDIFGNTKIIESSVYARDNQQADIVAFPELALTGYPPEDLLLRPELYKQTQKALKQIQTTVKNIYIILGLPTMENQLCFNSAAVIYTGKFVLAIKNNYSQTMGIYEKRYFTLPAPNLV